MPYHSRERERGEYRSRDRTRDRDRDRERDRTRYRYERGNTHDDRADEYDNQIQPEDDDDDDDDDDDVFDDRTAARHARHRSRPSPARRPPNPRHTRHDPYDDPSASESEVIVLDSRPNFARPPNIRPSPVRVDRQRSRTRYPDVDAVRDSGRRQHKAKESPATSPVKKRDRERDREGRRRRDSFTADERGARSGASPTKKVRERRGWGDTDGDEEDGFRRVRDATITPERDRAGGRSREDKRRDRDRDRDRQRRQQKHTSADSANSATQLLSADALAKLNASQAKVVAAERAREAKEEKKRRKREEAWAEKEKGRGRGRESSVERGKKKKNVGRRLVSGAFLEEGRSPELRTRGGGGRDEKWRRGAGGGGGGGEGGGGGFASWSKKKKILVILGVLAVLLIVIIVVAVVVAKKKGGDGDGGSDDPSGSGNKRPANTELEGIDRDSIPSAAKGTYFDPFSWYDTTDFNVTYTTETVGDLPIMGLDLGWDDSAQANENVPPLNKKFPYGKQPIRGVNIGGWLSIEPFITPSFFSQFSARDKIIDEYSLSKKLGGNAASTLEKHYATFINDQSFKEIRDAGLDHVRIPYSYWIVKTYDDDPYVAKIGFRYLLRAIEYCRKYGLRVKLDMHGVPGSQNGWNHSGRQGQIGWLEGDDGDTHAQRALDIHSQLSKFFAQDRYKNVLTIYGLANEPMMLKLDIEAVINWNTEAIKLIRNNGMKQYIAFGDGFLNLKKWKTMMQDIDDNLLLDTHQYTVFNTAQVGMTHKEKLELACDGWVELLKDSNTKGTGWGPTICGEWSQADTDCARYLNNVNVGSRWLGTMDAPGAKAHVTRPLCATQNQPTAENPDTQSDSSVTGPPCSCGPANADPAEYSDVYKRWLQAYAEAQMYAFEKSYGWFYWTWQTESAVQWSWKRGLEAGILPAKAYEPEFRCGGKEEWPDFEGLEEYY
ncbi:hypothetical protein FQN52_000489 [Onygenales sp. PD_12]|nr:hypothetical protein FQN52_000489 [Onygenales sp. PD_12]